MRLKGRVTNSTPSPLTGKLFDESGERLTPSHATKGERRYRYYISRGLMKDAPERTRGWRLAASEIERIVAASARQILDDQKTILDAVQELQIAPNQIRSILQDASAWSRRLEFRDGTLRNCRNASGSRRATAGRHSAVTQTAGSVCLAKATVGFDQPFRHSLHCNAD